MEKKLCNGDLIRLVWRDEKSDSTTRPGLRLWIVIREEYSSDYFSFDFYPFERIEELEADRLFKKINKRLMQAIIDRGKKLRLGEKEWIAQSECMKWRSKYRSENQRLNKDEPSIGN